MSVTTHSRSAKPHGAELGPGRVDIVKWPTSSPTLLANWRECITKSNNFRAWMQMPEWLDFHWRPVANTYLAVLRNQSTDDVIATTPLVENDYRLIFSLAGRRLLTLGLRGLLLVGNVPLFPPSEGYEALCRAVLALPSIDCFYVLGVPKTSAFWTFIAEARRQNSEWLFYTPNFESSRYLYIDMSTTFDEYKEKFKAKTLQTIKRKLRVMEKTWWEA